MNLGELRRALEALPISDQATVTIHDQANGDLFEIKAVEATTLFGHEAWLNVEIRDV